MILFFLILIFNQDKVFFIINHKVVKTTSFTFFFLLSCNLIFGQETKLYDADFFPIEKKKKTS